MKIIVLCVISATMLASCANYNLPILQSDLPPAPASPSTPPVAYNGVVAVKADDSADLTPVSARLVLYCDPAYANARPIGEHSVAFNGTITVWTINSPVDCLSLGTDVYWTLEAVVNDKNGRIYTAEKKGTYPAGTLVADLGAADQNIVYAVKSDGATVGADFY